MITVILCSYNGAAFIRRQIDSILSQRVKDFNLLVFDDCSTDGTQAILEEYKKNYPDKFDWIEREKPTGSSCANFMSAIAEAPEADYYMLSDQDDIWHKDKMNKMLGAIQHHESLIGKSTPILVHSDAVVVQTWNSVTDETKIINPSFIKFEGLTPDRVGFNQLLLQNQVTGGASIFNYALKSLVEVGHDMRPQPLIHDQWLAILCAAFGRIFYLDEALYDYRQHGQNEIGAKKASFIDETKRRLGLGDIPKAEIDEITRNEFLRIYAQAREFQRVYGDKLDARHQKALKSFCTIDNKPKLFRMFIALKYGFMFNKFYRKVGELIFI